MDQNHLIIILSVVIFLILFYYSTSKPQIESFDGCGRRRGPGTSYDERERVGDMDYPGQLNADIPRQGFEGSSNVYSEDPARGWYNGEIKKDNDFQKKLISERPCVKNYKGLGYDNPYIYPYNYCWNQNLPPTKFKYPGWFRQLWVDSDQNQFPGFMY